MESLCEQCCFAKLDHPKGCKIGQFCYIKNKLLRTFGYCRCLKPKSWFKNFNNTQEALDNIKEQYKIENFRIDCILIYRGEDLDSTQKAIDYIKKHSFVNRVILSCNANTIDDKSTIKLAEYCEKNDSILLDIYLQGEEKLESTVFRLRNLIISEYFLVLPINDSEKIVRVQNKITSIHNIGSRCILWEIPDNINEYPTSRIEQLSQQSSDDAQYILYMTNPYKQLCQKHTPFIKIVKKITKNTNISLPIIGVI